jgi:hypothetical protein
VRMQTRWRFSQTSDPLLVWIPTHIESKHPTTWK